MHTYKSEDYKKSLFVLFTMFIMLFFFDTIPLQLPFLLYSYHDTISPHTYIRFYDQYLQGNVQGEVLAMSLLVLRCLELVLPFRMVELRILQLKLMSPHREPSPVHYMTKSPVIAAYLRGRRCCLCQRDFIFRQPSSHILVFKSVIPVFFA